MASLGHIAVGMAAARLSQGGRRPSWRPAAAWAALSMLPDADVAAFALGVPYEHPWGHRPATHSFVFAAIVGAAALLLAPRLGLARLKTWSLATLVVGSHALLDTLTDGGLGCALFWPFDLTRYFAEWRPIPVSPIGLNFLSPAGAVVAASELLLFGPLFVYALRSQAPSTRSRARRVILMVAWLTAVWLIGSTDRVRQGLIAAIVKEQTEYAPRFAEDAFASISSGMSEGDVVRLLGPPLEQWWQYSDSPSACRIIVFEGERVVRWRNYDHCTPANISIDMSPDAVQQQLGTPPGALWTYSRSAGGRPYRVRAVWFEDGKVFDVMRRWGPGGAP